MTNTQQQRIPVQFNDGNKSKSVYMQLVATNNIAKIHIFDSDSSKKAKHEINLYESISEISLQDLSSKTVTLTTPSTIVNFIFNSPNEAVQNMKLFNSKSDVYKDINSVEMLNDQIIQQWPFPKDDLLS